MLLIILAMLVSGVCIPCSVSETVWQADSIILQALIMPCNLSKFEAIKSLS